MGLKCPDCGSKQINDADCDECDGGEEGCLACEGTGYLPEHYECASCGIVDVECSFEDDDDEGDGP